jgi:hypothetical protein
VRGAPIQNPQDSNKRTEAGCVEFVESEGCSPGSKMLAKLTVALLPQPIQQSVLLQLIWPQSSQRTAWLNGIRSMLFNRFKSPPQSRLIDYQNRSRMSCQNFGRPLLANKGASRTDLMAPGEQISPMTLGPIEKEISLPPQFVPRRKLAG